MDRMNNLSTTKSNSGWVSIHRKLQENPIYTKPNYLAVWIHLLLSANHKDKKIIVDNRPFLIKRGQYFGSIKKIADTFTSDDGKTHMSKSTVHYILEYLALERMIERNKNGKYSLITILNYDKYQDLNGQLDVRRTSGETNNNDNNDNNKYNGDLTSSVELEETEEGSISNTLSKINKKITSQEKTGITTSWQATAFRFAEGLGIKLPNSLKGQWLKEFKLAESDTYKNQKIQSAYGFLVDYAPFQRLNDEKKVKYFFWYIGSGYSKIKGNPVDK